MRTCLLLVFLFFVLTAFSQRAVISLDKMNVLYIGVDNPVSVAAENSSCKDLIVEISQGAINKNDYSDNPCLYTVTVKQPGKATISVKNKKGKLLGQVEFRVKRIPDPIATVGDQTGGIMSKNKLMVQRGIYAHFENFDFDFGFLIIGYDVATCRDGQLYSAEVMGATFTEEVRRIISNSNPGESIIFDNIKARTVDGSTRKLNTIKIYIDFHKDERCESILFNLYGNYPADSTYELKSDPYRQWHYSCNCESIDEASGNIIDDKKSGWWDYMKIKGSDTLIARREYYSGDTLKQILYKKGIKDKQQVYVLGELVGDYLEYHANGKIKLKGYYTVDSVSTDTITVIDPITGDERLEVSTNYSSLKSGTWQYFNEEGILIKEEKYVKGQLVK